MASIIINMLVHPVGDSKWLYYCTCYYFRINTNVFELFFKVTAFEYLVGVAALQLSKTVMCKMFTVTKSFIWIWICMKISPIWLIYIWTKMIHSLEDLLFFKKYDNVQLKWKHAELFTKCIIKMHSGHLIVLKVKAGHPLVVDPL